MFARSSSRFLFELDNRVCWFNRTEDVYRKDEESGGGKESVYKGRGGIDADRFRNVSLTARICEASRR